MSISLNNIVDVSVEISSPTALTSNFNLGLIVGDSTVIQSSERVRKYDRATFATKMISDGFTIDSPEYTGATAYFSQNPAPSTVVIGVKTVAETSTEAINGCRNKNEEFFGFCFNTKTALTEQEIRSIASATEAFSVPALFFFQTDDDKCLQDSTQNVIGAVRDLKLNYTCGNYSTQPTFTSALLGVFSGLNSMQANSAYTMAFKTLVGINPENVSNTQFLTLKGYNGNTYVAAGRTYQMYLQGLCASGLHVDEVYFLCVSKFLIQESTVAGLITRRKIAQTESGLGEIINFISNACETLSSIGLIATGVWNGEAIMDLDQGDAVPGGYFIQNETMASQSAADRAKRVTPPIYVALKSAGAIESVIIRVYVNR